MKVQGIGGGKNGASSEMLSVEWGNFDFYGYLDCI